MRCPYECEPTHKVERNDRHDAYLCRDCDEWLEEVCRDKECAMCRARPDKPSMVLARGQDSARARFVQLADSAGDVPVSQLAVDAGEDKP